MTIKLDKIAKLILHVEDKYAAIVAEFTAYVATNPGEAVVRQGRALMDQQHRFQMAHELKHIFTTGQELNATADQMENEIAKQLKRWEKQMLETHRWRPSSTCPMERVNAEMLGLALCYWITELHEIID